MRSTVGSSARGLLAAIAIAVVLAGCGAGPRRPTLGSVPLVAGGKVVARANACDAGADAYCALDVVLVDPHYATAQDLVTGEVRQLKRSGWLRVSAQTGDELAADSPNGRLRVTYATPVLDLRDIDLGWIKRPSVISLALSDTIYDRAAAMSMMVVALS